MTDEPKPPLSEWDEPKLNPPDDDFMGEPPLAKIRRGWVIGIAIAGSVLVGGSMVYAMARTKPPARSEKELLPRSYGTQTARLPESIRQLEVATAPAREPDDTPPDVVNAKPMVRYEDNTPIPVVEEPVDYSHGTEPSPSYRANVERRVRADRDESSDEAGLPWVVPPKEKGGLSSAPSLPTYQPGVVQPGLDGQVERLTKALQAAGGQEEGDSDDRKEAFAAKGGIDTLSSDEDDLVECDLSARTPVAASVIVATNSDVPAKNTVTIKISQTVYCGADRQHVALPQGSTFVGSVNAHVGYGDERQQLCMHQLDRPPSAGHPNGSRKQLGCFVVADITGQPGMNADVDNHWGQLISGALLSTALSLGTSASMGQQQGFAATTAQNAAHSAGANISQVGQRIVQRDLQRKPTLRTEQLEGVMVIFSSNLELEPWKPRPRR